VDKGVLDGIETYRPGSRCGVLFLVIKEMLASISSNKLR